MDISWEDVRLFLAAAETDSLSAGARQLGIGQATMSRRIARLEDNLGIPLFARSVDGIALTEAGTTLLSAARTMQDGALAFEAAAVGQADALRGKVRITTAPGLAVDIAAPFARHLREAHPHLRLHVLSDVGYLDVARGEADIALRSQEPRDPELMAAAQGWVKLGVYASQSYVDRLDGPASLDELDWVGWAPPHEGRAPEGWIRQLVDDFEPVFAADNFIVLQRAVAEGIGAILLPEIQSQGLSRVPLRQALERRLPAAPAYIVVSRAGWRSPRIRAVTETLVDWFNTWSTQKLELAAK